MRVCDGYIDVYISDHICGHIYESVLAIAGRSTRRQTRGDGE